MREDKVGWWFDITETFCDRCGSMQPSHQYQGHFICNGGGSITSFWIPAPTGDGRTLFPEAPSKWNNEGGLDIVPYKTRASNNVKWKWMQI